ncbi:DUF2577 domain-containing protein [Paenibacillus rigui]|uniref:DUF2577 domain-containing protein n=1 Tax=Paenibacillus rigui TaxID=554312 RepID=A0A229US46_9BACL|nr:DUF2577 domain-containing protein [Paenibacillus rigui]OXM86457.1 hypothetical protein CF651_09785 [Paenibacillus rigui]
MVEGSNVSKFVQLIRHIGYNDFDRFELATVLSPPPALRIRVDHMKIDLDAADVVVAEHLTEHGRSVRFQNDPISSASADEDSGTPSPLPSGDVLLTFKSPLQAGDRVIIASANAGQTYVILDKAVRYFGT